MDIQTLTEREIMISLNGEVKQLRETIERFGDSLIRLENTRIAATENRIAKLEAIETERGGVWKFFKVVVAIMGAIISYLTIRSFFH